MLQRPTSHARRFFFYFRPNNTSIDYPQVPGCETEAAVLAELVSQKDIVASRPPAGSSFMRTRYNPAEGLNPSQRQAVAAASARRLTLIQGECFNTYRYITLHANPAHN